jgi:transporter family-2 protein
MMALGLLGESMSSLMVDHFGLMGIPVRKMRREKVWGLLIILAGIAIMLTDFVLLPVIVSFCAGITVLLSRLVNGGLSRKSSVTSATLVNYLVGLTGAGLLALFVGVQTPVNFQGPVTNYLGGAVGTVIVIISNFVVGKIASFYMTLTLFVGQVTAGLLLDMMLQGAFPARNALGGLFVLLGLTLNLWQDRAHAQRLSRSSQAA